MKKKLKNREKKFLQLLGSLAIVFYPVPVTLLVFLLNGIEFINENRTTILGIVWVFWLTVMFLVLIVSVISSPGKHIGHADDAYLWGSFKRSERSE